MFKWLTKAKRRRAGWLIALSYLLCVLGPGLAYAIGGDRFAAPCFDDDHALIAVHTSDTRNASGETDGDHDRHARASHSHEANGNFDHRSHQHSHGLCCAMICTSGLPANASRDIAPSQSVSICALEPFLRITGQGPARLYRPPIT
jgi:hypothetical protein